MNLLISITQAGIALFLELRILASPRGVMSVIMSSSDRRLCCADVIPKTCVLDEGGGRRAGGSRVVRRFDSFTQALIGSVGLYNVTVTYWFNYTGTLCCKLL